MSAVLLPLEFDRLACLHSYTPEDSCDVGIILVLVRVCHHKYALSGERESWGLKGGGGGGCTTKIQAFGRDVPAAGPGDVSHGAM